MTTIYFDHAATSPMLPEAIRAYADAAAAGPANPSSLHRFGREARSRVTAARDELARILGCRPEEIAFTGGGTESDNAALYGAARSQRGRDAARRGIVTTAIEHHAVLNACRRLEEEGFELTLLPVDDLGRVSVEAAEAAIGPHTAVVSIMAANNETGTKQPIEEIGRIARRHGAVMHTDAVQAFGYEAFDLSNLPVDLLTVTAHKIGGPQGVGALYIRNGTPFQPTQVGGSQERARRAGTENVAGIAAFSAAAKIAHESREERRSLAETIRRKLIESLERELGADRFVVNGDPDPAGRLPSIANIGFPGIANETMLMNLDLAGVAASGGSACTSGSLQPSHVLLAMGLSDHFCKSAVRFSFGMGNTIEEAEKTAKIIATIAARLRKR